MSNTADVLTERVEDVTCELVQRTVVMETDRLMPSYPGRRRVIDSLVCAGLDLAVTPVVFGPLGAFDSN